MALINKVLGFEFVGERLHRIALALLLIGLPVSPFIVGLSQFILLGNWLLLGNFKAKWNLFLKRGVYWFALLPLVHVVYLWNTQNFPYAFHDLKIKIPLLILPIIIGTSPLLSMPHFKRLAYLFIGSTLVGSIISALHYFNLWELSALSYRDYSPFISHLRFGLMVLFSMLLLFYFGFIQNGRYKLLHLLPITWFAGFVFIVLPSVSNWIAFYFMLLILFVAYFNSIRSMWHRTLGVLILLSVPIVFIAVSLQLISNRGNSDLAHINDFPNYTANGNLYEKPVTNVDKENGNFVYAEVCWEELEQAWNNASSINFYHKDAKGHNVYSTLLRYMSSLGLSKDAQGFTHLDAEDIELVEQGHTALVYKSKSLLYVKVYEFIEEWSDYRQTGDANGKSFAMRMEFWKTGWYIVGNNFIFGTGTGDVNDAYQTAYADLNSNLLPENRLRAHNQYLTFLISFGVFGFILALLGMFGPAFKFKSTHRMLLLGFLCLLFFSMLTEDTLETQAGVTFYIAFYSLLLGIHKEGSLK